MFRESRSFSSFSANDLSKVKEFYQTTLGLDVSEEDEGLSITFKTGGSTFIYPKSDHQPATFTVLNFMVENIDQAVDKLTSSGIEMESYSGEMTTDDKGIYRGAESGNGPNIAWFKDPVGNILSVIEV
jgi:predicted enzyme related to lactoylglutathione lyase